MVRKSFDGSFRVFFTRFAVIFRSDYTYNSPSRPPPREHANYRKKSASHRFLHWHCIKSVGCNRSNILTTSCPLKNRVRRVTEKEHHAGAPCFILSFAIPQQRDVFVAMTYLVYCRRSCGWAHLCAWDRGLSAAGYKRYPSPASPRARSRLWLVLRLLLGTLSLV